VCASPFSVQAHHLRHAERRGMGRKNSDRWAVPLCAECHMKCHTRGDEADWWNDRLIDPIEWANIFHERWENETGRHDPEI
jgi:hypothetical protein